LRGRGRRCGLRGCHGGTGCARQLGLTRGRIALRRRSRCIRAVLDGFVSVVVAGAGLLLARVCQRLAARDPRHLGHLGSPFNARHDLQVPCEGAMAQVTSNASRHLANIVYSRLR
jgi:hypothetical protein